jgi:hypothetical protein
MITPAHRSVILAIEDKSDGPFVVFAYLNNVFARNAEFGILIGERSRHGKGLPRDPLVLVVADYASRRPTCRNRTCGLSPSTAGAMALPGLRFRARRHPTTARIRVRPISRRVMALLRREFSDRVASTRPDGGVEVDLQTSPGADRSGKDIRHSAAGCLGPRLVSEFASLTYLCSRAARSGMIMFKDGRRYTCSRWQMTVCR